MKKITALLLIVAMMAVMCSGCGTQASDWKYIDKKGTMVIGITLYEPMNYYDENNTLTGFDTEFAEAVCAELGVKPQFQEIEWEQKEFELKSKTIDVIWNGLTITEDRKADMAFSVPYVENKQVVIIQKANKDKYSGLDSLSGITIAAENGSAGASAIEEDAVLSQDNFIGVSAQKDALLEVKAGTVDACVIDYVMAKSVVNDSTDYSDLMIIEGVDLAVEEYAVGVRLEDTEFLAKLNDAIAKVKASGKLDELATKYGVNLK